MGALNCALNTPKAAGFRRSSEGSAEQKSGVRIKRSAKVVQFVRDLFNQIGAAYTSACYNMRMTIEVFGATSLVACTIARCQFGLYTGRGERIHAKAVCQRFCFCIPQLRICPQSRAVSLMRFTYIFPGVVSCARSLLASKRCRPPCVAFAPLAPGLKCSPVRMRCETAAKLNDWACRFSY